MGKTNNFDVLREMSLRDKKIKGFPGSNITNISNGKSRALVTIEVDHETAAALMAGARIGFYLLVWDIAQFDALKKELENE